MVDHPGQVQGNIVICSISQDFFNGTSIVTAILVTVRLLGFAGFILVVNSKYGDFIMEPLPFIVPGSLGLLSESFIQRPKRHGRKIRWELRFSLSDVFVNNTLISIDASDSITTARQLFDQTPFPDLVLYNTLINVYAKIGDMVTACELFASMPKRDVISWGTLLAGYSQTGCFTDALQLFDRMVATGLKPEAVAIVCVLSCCGQLWELERGKAIHEYLVRNRVRLNVYLSTGLVDMYVKCGCIGLAREMFESSRYRNLFTWNVIIVGLGMHGHGELTLEYFGRMVGTGVRLDGVSFVVVLWVVTRLVVGLGMHGHGELTFEYFGRMVGTGVRLDGVSFVVVLWVVTWLVDTARKLFGEMDGVERELKHYG